MHSERLEQNEFNVLNHCLPTGEVFRIRAGSRDLGKRRFLFMPEEQVKILIDDFVNFKYTLSIYIVYYLLFCLFLLGCIIAFEVFDLQIVNSREVRR